MKTQNKGKCIIIGGAKIKNYNLIRDKIKENDFFIFCDSGLAHMEKLRVKPNLIVGDFDSHPNPNISVETIILPCEKDDTDTFFAVKEGVARGFNDFLLIGVIGARLDHTIGNLSTLLYLDSIGKKGCIIDNYSEMEIVSKSPVSVDNTCSFFSLLNITGCARGITIKDAKYPLNNAEISCECQYGISNEVQEGKSATVYVKEGKLLLIKVYKDS